MTRKEIKGIQIRKEEAILSLLDYIENPTESMFKNIRISEFSMVVGHKINIPPKR